MENKVSVLVLGYNDKKNIEECVSSLTNQSYKNYDVWFADNASFDGSFEYVKNEFPRINSFQFIKNCGYAEGNNRLIKKAFNSGSDFCLVLNADTKIDVGLLSSLVDTYKRESKKTEKVGLIQPVIFLYDKPDKINTIGNTMHYLGFGYCGNYLSDNVPDTDKEISSVSGTAMFISKKYYEDVGSLDEDFFMYNEDQNYSWRGLMMGYKHFLSVDGKVWHKYLFSKNGMKMYSSEKNRLMMIFENYQTKTILLMLPNIFLNELMLMVYSFYRGWFIDKMRSYFYFFSHLSDILKKRKMIQKNRIAGDSKVMRMFDYRLSFVEMDNFIIKYFVNSLYYVFYRFLILVV